jgi:hypothetical protein
VALLLRERAAPQGDPERAKLAFTYGFLVRCCEEVAPDAGRE